MKQIKINAYEYKELNEDSKCKVKLWLDQDPIEYEEEDEQGNVNYKYRYFSEMDDEDLQEHCSANGYLFNKHGKFVHRLKV